MYNLEKLKVRADQLLPEIVQMRRHFHMNPELGMEEYETAATVAEYLNELGLQVETGVGGTGVVGVLRGSKPGRTIAFRADMDALPIEEDTGLEYASRNSGKMHACGHDAHTANLMGTAKMLVELTDGGQQLNGNVKFLFQPAEESTGGAKPMIQVGALEDPPVDAVFGLHVSNDLASGEISVKSGVVNSSSDDAVIQVLGEGGHAAHPETAVDSVVVSAHVVTALQTISSREVSHADPVGLTIGKIYGGHWNNMIAPSVTMEVTIRSMNPEIRKSLPERIERIVRGVTESMRADYDFEYRFAYPAVQNDEEMVRLLRETAGKMIGTDRIVEQQTPSMGGEDFAYFAQEAPGCFFRLGVRNEGKGLGIYPGHHPKFNMDEEPLKLGMMLMSGVAMQYLHKQKSGR